MSFNTLSVTRTGNSPIALWGADLGLIRLIVVFVEAPTDEYGLYYRVYGVDPLKVDPEIDLPLFERILPAGGLGEFLQYLVNGVPNSETSDDPVIVYGNNHGSPIIANSVTAQSVDVSVPPTAPPGPKLAVVFDFADVLRNAESRAENAPPEEVAMREAGRRRSVR